ncbi:MAG TPA: hypothetical protein PLA68_12475, partial [Panacibacter sp.]|nr:hypothetical protein [Panacibacter sp.]
SCCLFVPRGFSFYKSIQPCCIRLINFLIHPVMKKHFVICKLPPNDKEMNGLRRNEDAMKCRGRYC